MKIVITGNLGYVGPSLIKRLRHVYPEATLVGIDLGLFAHCLTVDTRAPEVLLNEQIFADVRNPDAATFADADAVVHLAAISNDPMGNAFEAVTDEINYRSSVEIARLAADAGVRNFVFASSCSVYGFVDSGPRKEEDELNPLTAYARSKVESETKLSELASDSFVITCLRFATACGFSDRTRLDLVLNDFVAGAVSRGEITILSDGTPWRPLIHVDDMALAIDWAIGREVDNGGKFLTVNAGSDDWNYQVRELAEAVADVVKGTKISINPDAVPDKRSYQVDFSKFRELAPGFQPVVTLTEAVKGLEQGLQAMGFNDPDFRNSQFIRLKVLNDHLNAGRVDKDLNWLTDST